MNKSTDNHLNTARPLSKWRLSRQSMRRGHRRASNSGTIFSSLPSLYNHEIPGVNNFFANTMHGNCVRRPFRDKDCAACFDHSAIPGTGPRAVAGGFKMMMREPAGAWFGRRCAAANEARREANKDPHFGRGRFTLFTPGSPSVYADIHRVKRRSGVTPTRRFSDATKSIWGYQYVNDLTAGQDVRSGRQAGGQI